MSLVRSTDRWRGVTAGALLAAGTGLLLSKPAVLLASVVVVAYAAAARAGEPPEPDLAVERSVEADEPTPGDTVAVTTTVTNEGGTLVDLRLFDGVPEGLTVTAGDARANLALRAGESATLEYEVVAVRGEHSWEPPTAVVRDAAGARERETTLDAPATGLTCVPRLESVGTFPLRALTTPYTGRVASREAGEGVEFHSLREYRPGDPLGHVDWNHLARTGELATQQFHAEQMASVVLLFDVRPVAYAGHPDLQHNAVEHALAAGRKLLGALLDEGNRVGVAGLGVELCFLEPGMGRDHRARAERFLATADPLSSTPPDGQFLPSEIRELRKRLRGEVQVVWLSPVLDVYGVEVPRRLESSGHAVTVVSPDVTGEETPGRRVARAERQLRVNRLREVGVRVVDWQPPEALDVATSRAARGWRR
jgi:uncharacterized protein (DUF58 family)